MTEAEEHEEPTAASAGFETPPAPVVTDTGVYGTLPRTRPFPEYDDEEGRGHPLLAVATGLLVLAAAALLLVLSASQVTGTTVALPTIERGIEALTGLERLLALHEDEIRRAALAAPSDDAAIPVPGFEVAGVSITRREVLEGNPDTWHDLLRSRAATALYANGVDVLAPSGTATDGGLFSASGGARFIVETLSESRHSLASFLVLPLTVTVAVAGAGVLAFGRGFGRFQALGFGVAVASLPAVAAGVLGMGVLMVLGGGSALADEVHAMASEIVDVPLRNGLTALAAGVAVGVLAKVLGVVFPVREAEPAYVEDGVPSR